MRRQRLQLTVIGSLALAAVLAFASPAAAQETDPEETEHIIHDAEGIAEANGASHGDVECIPTLVEGGSMQDCWEAPNPLLPELNEIIWGAVGFIVVFLVLAKFGFPAMKKGMDARAERIRSDLQSAEDQRSDAETVLAEYRAQLNDARTEASRIIDEARQAADQLKRDRETELQGELAGMRERAQSDIAASKAQATEDLRDDLAQLAIGAAEAVVQRSLDAKTQKQLVNDYIDRVAGSRA